MPHAGRGRTVWWHSVAAKEPIPVSLLLLIACGHPPPPNDLAQSTLLQFRSDDGQSWVSEGALATGFDSLGLDVGTDEWVLTGLDHDRRIGLLEPHLPKRVRGFEGQPGAWTRTQWTPGDDQTLAYIDPQRFEDHWWYIRHTGTGDPATSGLPTELVHDGAVRLTQHGVADPSPVRVGDTLHVFVTVWGQGVVQLRQEDDLSLTQVQAWPNVTVPYALWVDDTLHVWAVGVVDNRRAPVHTTSVDGVRFGPWTPVDLPGDWTSCTSPVAAPHDQGWVLLCVDEHR